MHSTPGPVNCGTATISREQLKEVLHGMDMDMDRRSCTVIFTKELLI